MTGFGIGAASILDGGGTIDTNGRIVSISGGIDYGAQLTVTGGGVLFISDATGDGAGTGGINLLSGTLSLGGDFAAGDGKIAAGQRYDAQNGAFCFCGGTLILANNIEVDGTATIDGSAASPRWTAS